jgi:ketosteroid isomerase-like protein
MKKFLLLALMGIALTASAQQDDDIATLKKLNADWIAGYPAKDTAVYSRIFADDFILINPDGKKFTKRDVLTGLAAQTVTATKVDTVEVQLHGTIGLVIAKASFTSRTNGKETRGQTGYLDVYEKRNGRWWAIVAHVTYLGEPAP